jgi:hypothetical protein
MDAGVPGSGSEENAVLVPPNELPPAVVSPDGVNVGAPAVLAEIGAK